MTTPDNLVIDGVSLPAQPALNRRFRMQFEPAQAAHVLLYPEGMVKLNGTAAAILSLCDGSRSIEEIVDSLERQYNTTGLYNDVVGWMVTATRSGWIT